MDTTARYTCWSLTINNPTDEDTEAIATARQKGWKIVGQVEKGFGGTPHLQIALTTPQTRFSTVKKHFPRAHIEPAKNVAALHKYVSKEETRIGSLPTTEQYPSLSKLWDLLYDRYNTDDKDGWNLTLLPHRVQLYDEDHQDELDNDPLKWFDQQIGAMIEEGYHVETLAMNPSTRSSWKRYYNAILVRSAMNKHKEAIEHNNATEEDQLRQEAHVQEAPHSPSAFSSDTRSSEPRSDQ